MQGRGPDRQHRGDRRPSHAGRRDERLLGERFREARADRLRPGAVRRLVPHQGAGQHADQLRDASTRTAAGSWSSAPTSTCARARSSTGASAATRTAWRAGRCRPTRIPMAARMLPAHDLNIPRSQFMIINYQQTHRPGRGRQVRRAATTPAIDTVARPAGTTLDLTAVPDTTRDEPHLPARLRQPLGRDDGRRAAGGGPAVPAPLDADRLRAGPRDPRRRRASHPDRPRLAHRGRERASSTSGCCSAPSTSERTENGADHANHGTRKHSWRARRAAGVAVAGARRLATMVRSAMAGSTRSRRWIATAPSPAQGRAW